MGLSPRTKKEKNKFRVPGLGGLLQYNKILFIFGLRVSHGFDDTWSPVQGRYSGAVLKKHLSFCP